MRWSRRHFAPVMLLSFAAGLAAAQPLAAPQVAATALQQKLVAAVARDLQVPGGIETIAGELEVLNPALSLAPDAELRVTSVQSGFVAGSWLLRVDCSLRRDCLPFHVVLHVPPGSWSKLRSRELANSAPSAGKPRQVHAPLARSGDRVLLVEELPGMRLKAGGVCLESGGLGDVIRVRNLATHRILLAIITGKNEVRVE